MSSNCFQCKVNYIHSLFSLQKDLDSTKGINVYISEYDNDFSPNSPRNRIMSTSKKCIPNDLIPNHSILQKIYDSPLVRSFFLDLLNKNELHPYEDPLSSININYFFPSLICLKKRGSHKQNN